jgi:hypothetical protein
MGINNVKMYETAVLAMAKQQVLYTPFFLLKETVPRDFRLHVFFSWISFPQAGPLGPFQIFRQFPEIFVSQGAPPVSTTPVANFPPVSITPAANFATSDNRGDIHKTRCTTGVVDTCGTLTCEYLRECSKKLEMTLTLFSGVWGKMIHQKNLPQIIL